MSPYFTSLFANAASSHGLGRQAALAVDNARAQVAALVGGRPAGVVFTSGATEANNLVLRGLSGGSSPRRKIVTVATEHPSVLEPAAWLTKQGWEVTVLPVGDEGDLDLDRLASDVDSGTLLVSAMAANNEIGTLHPLADIAAIAHDRGALFHSDATQLAGKLPICADAIGLDLVSMSAHKLYGPKGVGALYLSREAARQLSPQILGGGHERGLRSGTLNVPGCVGFGTAAEIASDAMPAEAERLLSMAARLHALLLPIGGVTLNGPGAPRLPGNLNVCIEGTRGDDLILRMPDLAVATGSACSSASPNASHVLLAIGRSYEEAESALRLGCGRFTTDSDLGRAASLISRVVEEARSSERCTTGGVR
jgi:cysteine desulfurase